jgi:hypothetical protein
MRIEIVAGRVRRFLHHRVASSLVLHRLSSLFMRSEAAKRQGDDSVST